MTEEYSIATCKKMEQKFHNAHLHRPMRISRYESGSQLGFGVYRAMVKEDLSRVMISIKEQMGLKYVPFRELIDEAMGLTLFKFIKNGSDFQRLARILEY